MQRQWMRFTAFGLIIVAAMMLGAIIKGLVDARASAGSTPTVDVLSNDAELVAPTEDAFDPLEPTPRLHQTTQATTQPAAVVVYISGAVVQPGTYRLENDARVDDVVRLAGGLTEDADRNRINLSEHIHDAQHILITRIGEVASPAASDKEQAGASNNLININTASAGELDTLPGIGEVLAQRIVDWRTTNGPFTSTDEITQVKGVSSSLYDQLKNLITVQ